MYLKSLELQGFKSFPDKTKLNFESGATVIVGPNGSGKSNISDAMRWVLGERSTKNIRGDKMEDIIFGGSESRKQMGYAEVSITFDNRDPESRLDCPYDEVTVTRRYYRSGDSEYYINRQSVRLADIYELFMNTGIGRDGYSIIGQGKIAEIISRKSDERRSIFEDASGIAKYRMKKNSTEKKLAEVEDNMTRINDIFLEVSAQVAPLEKEADKASRAIELLETKKRVDVQLWLFDTDKLRTEIAEAEKLYNESNFSLNAINDTIASFEAQNERLFETSQRNKYESDQLLTRINEQTRINHNLDSEYKVAETNILHTTEMLSGAGELIKSYERSIERENAGIAERQAKISELTSKLDAEKKAHENAVARQGEIKQLSEKLDLQLAESLEEIRIYEKEANDIKVRLSVIDTAKENDDGKNSTTLEEIEKYDKMAEELSAKVAKSERTLADYEAKLKETNADISAKSTVLDSKYIERDDVEEKIDGLKLKRDTANQRIENFRAMEEQLEGYSNSVRYVMKAYSEGKITDKNGNRCGKIYGPFSKV
ncbi:MAG: AAA family ATPase, partial [Clostridia bacterium]|nr:AAA family ATPase [Clostridia bacterium]